MIILSVGKIKRIILVLLVFLLFYTRLAGLNWGLPYPFHPDERNMTLSIQQLHCDISDFKDCFNPHFFAYGQFPLYLGYGLVDVLKFFDGDLNTPIGFQEATIALRLISVLASILLAYFLIKIIQLLNKNNKSDLLIYVSLLIITFSPALIQFAHFGTTESLLMLFYAWIVYESLLLIKKKITARHFIIITSIVSGLAIATKVSSLVFMLLPAAAVFYFYQNKLLEGFKLLVPYFCLSLLVGLFLSPYNLLSFNDFMGSLRYESAVALGTQSVFYTRQFAGQTPALFQSSKIFPYALGWPVLLFFIGGFFLLPFKKQNNFLRFSFLVYFLANAFLYAKWTRFMAPVIPIMLVVAILFLFFILAKVKNKLGTIIAVALSLVFIIPGLAYFSIYQQPDVRLTASEWINKNIPEGSLILSETGNVVDIPLDNPKSLRVISFNFYDLDSDKILQQELEQDLQQADYIFIPSRRIFMNHPQDKYPLLGDYYNKLFSGKLGFSKIAEFHSYPRISFLGQTLLEFPDEEAEETWTVFDHPVIRIYQRAL